MIGWTEVILRLAAAMVIGGVIGLDRNLHHKPTGVRTLGLVALGSAIVVLTVEHDSQADISRVVQGVITGVGFIGAGVILHRPREFEPIVSWAHFRLVSSSRKGTSAVQHG